MLGSDLNLLLLVTALVLVTSPTSAKTFRGVSIWPCLQRDSGNNSFSLINVDWEESNVGIIQTPNFPHPFPLPMRCAWLFNNAQMKETHGESWHLDFYFTQFYLSHELLSISSFNSTTSNSQINGNITWSDLNALGDPIHYDWFEFPSIRIDDDYVIIKLDIDATTHDHLHLSVLEVNDVYGLNITYEGLVGSTSNEPEFNNSCSLLECNLNGECFADISPSSPPKLSGFHCECAFPKFSPSEKEKPFEGDRCQFHERHAECTPTKQPCLHGGKCRYFTSRYVACDCPPEWTGHRCEIPNRKLTSDIGTSANPNANTTLANQTEEKCVYTYAMFETNTFEAEKILQHANGKLYNAIKVDSNHSTSTLFFSSPSGGSITEAFIEDLKLMLIQGLPSTNFSDLAPAKFCTERELKLTPQDHKKFVTEGDQFWLSCLAHGYKRPVFVWTKDYDYSIQANLTEGSHVSSSTIASFEKDHKESDRFIKFVPWHEDNHSFMLINPANMYDNGLFMCQVFETVYDGMDLSDLTKFPVQSATFRVDILQKPKIEVFPMSATLVKVRRTSPTIHRHQGPNTLSCFAASSISFEAAKNYLFYWMRDGKNISDIWPRTEFESQMRKPVGKSLKLGLIQTSGNYTCVVVDKRDIGLRSEITVDVQLADSEAETCQSSHHYEIMWPRTRMGAKAIVGCSLASGYMFLSCNSEGLSVPQWSSIQPDKQHCFNDQFMSWQRSIERYLSGYVKNATADANNLMEFVKSVKRIAESRKLTRLELKTTLKLLRMIFNVIRAKDLPIDYTALPAAFFSQCLPTILNSQEEISDLVQVLDLLQILSQIFGSKAPQQNNATLLTKSNGLFSWSETPGKKDCIKQSLVSVKLVEITMSHKNSVREMFTFPNNGPQISRNQVETSSSNDVNERFSPCGEPSRVSLTLKISSDKFIAEANPSLAIIRFDDIDKKLKGLQQEEKLRNAKVRFSVDSSVVTVFYSETFSAASSSMPPINVTIRFMGNKYKSENDTLRYRLSCGRANWHLPVSSNAQSTTPLWIRDEPGCRLRWHIDGLECVCNTTGTFAIMKAQFYVDDEARDRMMAPHYPVTFCCGTSVALTILTLFILVGQLRERAHFVTLMHAQTTALATCALLIILIAVAKFTDQSSSVFLSASLQLFLLSALVCQLGPPVLACLDHLTDQYGRQIKSGLIASSFLLPALYCSISQSLAVNTAASELTQAVIHQSSSSAAAAAASSSNDDQKSFWLLSHSHWKSWFIKRESWSSFVSYLTINLVIIGLHLILCLVLLVRKFCSNKNSHKTREGLGPVVKSFLVLLSILFLNFSIINFVNSDDDTGSEIILAICCAALGLIIFFCYVMKADQRMSSKTKLDPLTNVCLFKSTSDVVVSAGKDEPLPRQSCIEVKNQRKSPNVHSGYSAEGAFIDGSSTINESSSLLSMRNSEPSPERGHQSSLRSNRSRFSSSQNPMMSKMDRVLDPVESISLLSLSRQRSLQDQTDGIYNNDDVIIELTSSPIPLVELLKTADQHEMDLDDDLAKFTSLTAPSSNSSSFRGHRPPRTLTGGSYDSTCSSYDSACPRSRKNTATTTASNASDSSSVSTTVRSASKASHRSDDIGQCEDDVTMSTGYVIMRRLSSWSPPASKSVKNSNVPDARSERQPRTRGRNSSSSGGDSAEHSSVQDSIEFLSDAKPDVNANLRHDIFRQTQSSSGSKPQSMIKSMNHRCRKTRRSIQTSKSLPQIYTQLP